MIISIIVAMDKNRGIGFENALPWAGKAPRDMKRFKEITTGGLVIMGRKTFESIGKPLPNRLNVVLSRDQKYRPRGVFVFGTLDGALEFAEKHTEEAFIIGGASLYEKTLPVANRMFITEIDHAFTCDTFFPKYDPLAWRFMSLNVYHPDDRNAYKMRFMNLERKTTT